MPFFPRLRAKVTILSIKWIIWVGQSVLLNLSLQQISKTINYKSTIMKTTFTALGLSLLFILAGCAGKQQPAKDNFIQDNIDNAVAQHTLQTDIIEKSGKILNPRTINKDGSIHYIPIDDWCSGFFPGSMWLTYELTGDKKWLPLAEKYTEALDSVQYLTWHHDVGFMIGCSYLNGYRLAQKEAYKPVIVALYPFPSRSRCHSVVGCRPWLAG